MGTEELKAEISKLELPEKLSLIEDVWDDIANSNAELPLPEWQKAELDRRLGLYNSGEMETKEWTEVHEGLRKKYE